MRISTLFGLAVVALSALGCGDDSAEDGSGGATSSSTSASSTGSTSSTGTGPTTAVAITEARCESFATDTPTPLDGGATPPALVAPDGTLYEMSLHEVQEPTQYVGLAEVQIVQPGKYFILVMEEPDSGQVAVGAIREILGGVAPNYYDCNACRASCDNVESAWVYDLQAATYEVVIGLQDIPSVRLLVQPVEG